MKRTKRAFLFALALLPIAAIGGYFVLKYELDMLDPAAVEALTAQAGSPGALIAVSVFETVFLTVVLGLVGYILSDALGLMKPVRFEKSALLRTLGLSVVLGILFSLDYWTFGKWIPELNIAQSTAAGLTLSGWLGAVFYGGVIEEVLMRLFCMSLAAWLGRKLFFRKRESEPDGVVIAANVLAAVLFAAGHLPATVTFFGGLTPMLVLRCFLLNGCFGLFFGWLYRRYGIQYAMLGHALLHIVSKLIWTIFI